MANRTYSIVFEVNESNAIRGIDATIRKLDELDAKAKAVGAELKNFMGTRFNTSGVEASLKAVVSALNTVSADAKVANVDLGKVGTDRTNLKLYEAQLHGVISAIKALPTGPKMGGATAGAAAPSPALGMAASLKGAGAYLAAGLGAREALQRVAATSADQRERQQASSALVVDLRSSLQELANLTGFMGTGEVTEKTIRDQLAFQLETGTTTDKAIAFREQFRSSIGAGEARGNITGDIADITEKDLATFMARTKMDPAMAGKLAGNISEYEKISRPHQILENFGEMGYYLNKFGLGKMADIAAPLQELRGRFLDAEGGGGKFASEADMTLMYALTTNRGPKSPAANKTMMVQAQRALRRFEGDTGESLRRLGITPDMDYLTALRKMQPTALGPDADITLSEMGFGNSTERTSLIRQASVLQTFDKLRGDPKFQADVKVAKANAVRDNQAFLASQAGQDIRSETMQLIQSVNEGIRVGKIERAMESAKSRLLQQQKDQIFGMGTISGGVADAMVPVMTLWTQTGEEARTEYEAFRSITEQARARGIDVKKSYPDLERMGDFSFTREDRAKLFEKIYDDVVSAGGNPGAYELEQAGKLLQEGAKKMKAQAPVMLQPGNGFDAARGGP